MGFDIYNPQISIVSHDIAGKTILVYGDNGLGKTKQACRLPKPFYLPFERGINAIANVPFVPINKWADFVKINMQLTNTKNLETAQEMYSTIIFDTIEAAYAMCEQFICQQYSVNRINDGNSGYGLWREAGTEFWRQINLLTGAGYTVYFIAHVTDREEADPITDEVYLKRYPNGDKRAVDPICNLVDFIGYVATNGTDESGKEIPSSIFFKNSKEFKARSRFDYMVEYIETFTAENLQQAIGDAVKAQEEVEGIKTVSFTEHKKTFKSEEKSLEEMQKEIKKYVIKINKLGRMEEYQDIVDSCLGVGASVKEATKNQTQQLEIILEHLKQLDGLDD
jgi:hypothetical protein